METPPPASQRRRSHHPISAHGSAHAERADRHFLRLHVHHAGDDHAADGHRLAVPHPAPWIPRVNISMAARPTSSRYPRISRPGSSGPSPSTTTRRVRCRHAAALPARRQPELSDARGQGECRRLHDRLFRPDQTQGRERWQLDPDRSEERLVYRPPPLQPARTVLHQAWRPSEIELVKGYSVERGPNRPRRSIFIRVRDPRGRML